MRSIATPKEIIDMMTSTTPMPLAGVPIVPHISMRFISPPENGLTELLQREIDGDRHDDRHRDAVQQRRRELPLLDRIERRLIQQWDRAENLRFFYAAVG